MNNHYAGAAAGNASDAANTRTFLQQAVDHYPRLVAFSFTLVLPHHDTMADYRSLILRFHTEVWQRMGEYSQARHQERKNSPPTLLRWIWEAVCVPECKMVLLMNGDTLNAGQNTQLTDGTRQVLNAIIVDAWQEVTGTVGTPFTGVTTVTPFVIRRTGRNAFTEPFNQLKTRVQEMTLPVTLARTGVICA